MQGFERIEKILGAIPNAREIWPEWFWPHCPNCGHECDLDWQENPFCNEIECDIRNTKIHPVYKFGPVVDEADPEAWHGTETDPRNMHHLWRILCKVDVRGVPTIDCDSFPHPRLRVATIQGRHFVTLRSTDLCSTAVDLLCVALGVE